MCLAVVTSESEYDSDNIMVAKANNFLDKSEIVNNKANIHLFQTELINVYITTFNNKQNSSLPYRLIIINTYMTNTLLLSHDSNSIYVSVM